MQTSSSHTYSENLGKMIGSGLSISTKYVIPFAAGFYVGITDGTNQEIEPITKYTLLTAPTAANMGLTAIANGFPKVIVNLLKNPKIRYEAFGRPELKINPVKAREALSKLEELADTNIKKKAAKSVIKPGVMTAIGYAMGYGYTKIIR